MDPKTSIKDHSCACGRTRSNCLHSTLERSRDLIAQRVGAGSSEELNLASLGVHQKPKHPTAVKKMKHIQIEFRTHDERLKFEARFRETQRIYHNKLVLYHADMRKEKQNHSVSLFLLFFLFNVHVQTVGHDRP